MKNITRRDFLKLFFTTTTFLILPYEFIFEALFFVDAMSIFKNYEKNEKERKYVKHLIKKNDIKDTELKNLYFRNLDSTYQYYKKRYLTNEQCSLLTENTELRLI